MKIYKLTHSEDGYKSVNLDGTALLDIIVDGFYNGKPCHTQFAPFQWIESSDDLTPKAPFIMGTIPVVKKELLDAWKEHLAIGEQELLPMQIAGEDYVLIRTLKTYSNVLNQKASSIRRLKDGTIYEIEKYVFLPSVYDLPSMFMIEELPSCTFINEVLASKLKAQLGDEIQLEECEVKNHGFFAKILSKRL